MNIIKNVKYKIKNSPENTQDCFLNSKTSKRIIFHKGFSKFYRVFYSKIRKSFKR